MDAEYRRYCFDLLSQTVRDYGGEGNVMISPASIMMALDMVAAGAKEDSLRQLTDLFAVGQGPLSQQAYAASLMDKINNSKDVDFSCANAVWNNSLLLGDMVNTEYVDYIRETFLAEYTVTDFNDKTCDEINGWIYDHTDKKIKNMIEDLDRDTVMVLVNAITFDGKWEEPYEKDNVKDGDFTAANGKVQKATFLNDTSYIYFETDKATGFTKNYKGGEYAFLAILPKDASVSANEFAKSFTSKDYEDFISSRTAEYTVYSKMPEFKSDYSISLIDAFKKLGMETALSDAAQFGGMLESGADDLKIGDIIHKTHIEVDRNGTKAAAVTVVEMDKCSVEMDPETPVFITLDRPFVYAIVETDTGLPVFLGTVNTVE